MYSTGNSKHSAMAYMRKYSKNKEWIYMYVYLIHYAVHLKLTQHYKSIYPNKNIFNSLKRKLRKWVVGVVESLSHVWLFEIPWTNSPPGSSVHGISQVGIFWSGLPLPSPRDLPDSGIKHTSPALAGRFYTAEPPGSLKKWDPMLKDIFFR